jgi:hypothetical protein
VTARSGSGADPPSLEVLLERNRQRCDDHTKTAVFDLLRSDRLEDPAFRHRFLDWVQVWSTNFQRALLARSAFTDDERYAPTFRVHLAEEFGHDSDLAADRGDRPPPWDPQLDAMASWWTMRLLSADNADRAVLVHLVLETGSAAISGLGRAVFDGHADTDYFAVHEALDPGHEKMAIELLTGLDETTYARLLTVQQRGWDMLDAMCDRLAFLALEAP